MKPKEPEADEAERPNSPDEAGGKFWLNTSSGVRHNSTCKNFGKTKHGRYCGKDEGKACGICGGLRHKQCSESDDSH